MSGFVYQPAASSEAWQRYMNKQQAAQDDYLAVSTRAHLEYLTGPWPDREAYDHVERSAWMTYYATCREAWRTYTREMERPWAPPLPTPYPDGLKPAYTPLNESDQRQETYLAAGTDRREPY